MVAAIIFSIIIFTIAFANIKSDNLINMHDFLSSINSVGSHILPNNKDITAEININDLKNNLNYLKKKSGTELMPVLKADGYGHGITKMAKILRKIGIKYIGVATLGEALLLRQNGDKGRILGWIYNVDGPELVDAFKNNIDIAIFDETTISKFVSRIPVGKVINVTVFVDTGINRAGIRYEKALETCIKLKKYKNIRIEGLMSHLVDSEVKNSPITNGQLTKFRNLRKQLKKHNINPPLVHIANTGGILNYDVSDFTLARPGSGIYGVSPDNIPNEKLKLIMTVTSFIIQVKEVKKGEGIGYNWIYTAPRNMKVCIIPIGYGDIVPRATTSELHIFINGKKRKVLGRISMDQIVVEASDSDKLYDIVYVFGNGENCPQTIYDIAQEANTIPLEIFTHCGYRINRIYTDGNLERNSVTRKLLIQEEIPSKASSNYSEKQIFLIGFIPVALLFVFVVLPLLVYVVLQKSKE